MQKINAIKATKEEIFDLLRVITEEGKLIGNENEAWEDYIGFVADLEDLLSNKMVLEKLALHFDVGNIIYTDINYDTEVILLMYQQEEI